MLTGGGGSMSGMNKSLKENRKLRDGIRNKYFKKSNVDLGDNTKTGVKYELLTDEQIIRLGIAEGKRLESEILMGLAIFVLISVTITLLGIFIL